MNGLNQFVTKSYDKTPVKQRKEKMAVDKRKSDKAPSPSDEYAYAQWKAGKDVKGAKTNTSIRKMAVKVRSENVGKRLMENKSAKPKAAVKKITSNEAVRNAASKKATVTVSRVAGPKQTGRGYKAYGLIQDKTSNPDNIKGYAKPSARAVSAARRGNAAAKRGK